MGTFWKSPFFWAFWIGVALLSAIRPLQYAARSAPPPLASPGAWRLVNHEGRPFGAEDLRGKVWVANFFFTRCPSICPELTRKLDEVRTRFPGDNAIRFVSFSVDPEHDRPAILAAHRERLRIDDDRWAFVTGSVEEVHEWLVSRLRLHIGPPATEDPQSALFDISHTGKFALFDQNGDLRALVGTEEAELARLVSAAQLLIEEGPNP